MFNDLILIRHGQSEWQANLTKSKDSRLTLKGREQAKQLGLNLERTFDIENYFIITSPLVRAIETAKIAVSPKHHSSINVVEGVRLENGNYPTLRLYFVQQWRRMRDQQFINRDSFLLKRLNGSFYINRIPECYRRRM
ncbi:phosphoglycerate mutase family protein [Providencia sp. PROV255]|uniref:phosphoglycerate mutase family protein n=1 Tax=Providencia sp. PROV255 TaxID=2949943 RepID=UPI003FA68AC9